MATPLVPEYPTLVYKRCAYYTMHRICSAGISGYISMHTARIDKNLLFSNPWVVSKLRSPLSVPPPVLDEDCDLNRKKGIKNRQHFLTGAENCLKQAVPEDVQNRQQTKHKIPGQQYTTKVKKAAELKHFITI